MAPPSPTDDQHARDGTVDFGYERVKAEEKAARVAEVFRSVAPRYDLMNDLMSLGTHRLMKRLTVTLAGVRPGHRVLDLAGGTGDVAALLARRNQGGRAAWQDILSSDDDESDNAKDEDDELERDASADLTSPELAQKGNY